MLLSAVSVLVVAQSSSEIPEGLTNNPVLLFHCFLLDNSPSLKSRLWEWLRRAVFVSQVINRLIFVINVRVCVLGFTICPLQGSDFSVVVISRLLFPKVSGQVHYVGFMTLWCRLVGDYQRFEGTYCFHLLGLMGLVFPYCCYPPLIPGHCHWRENQF